jgi:hypothetical protein
MTRVDSLLQELSARHGNRDPRFLAAVRPMVERILAPGLADEARTSLLEMLAETCERDVAVRRDCAAAREHLAAFFAQLLRLLRGE